jgi:hypothetical protein
MATYDGPVVFVQGVHYPANEEGHADLTRPLRHVALSEYRDAEEGDVLHNDAYHEADVEVEPGTEE